MGIKKIHNSEELWRWLDKLGDEQSYFLLEQYIPGDVCHVDGIVSEKEVVFSVAHRYGAPPMNVAHEGGVFVTRTLPRDSEESNELLALNERLMKALGMVRGATHTEFIRGEDGELYFLETAARVGGANIDRLVEAATGIDLWAEWARIEVAHLRGETYTISPSREAYGGLLVCLSQQEWPDLSSFAEPEVVWWLNKRHHAGLIVAAESPQRVQSLIASYTKRFAHEFLAIAPPLDKPPD